MKLKRFPDDFVVTEINGRNPGTGRYALYRLSKRSIGTLEAVQILQRSWNIAPSSVAHAGLKDRHANTSQLITLKDGPRADFEHEVFFAEYLGQTETPITAQDIVANHFQIVVRSLSATDAAQILQRTQQIRSFGYPNYFDQQRFGSLGASRQFVAERWCRRDFQQALWLALAEHNSHDDASERAQKQILRDLWGQWDLCKQQLDRSHRRSVVTFLCDHPTNFRKAFALINGDLRGLYLSAFQSAVWNRMLAELLTSTTQPTDHSLPTTMLELGDALLPLCDTSHLAAGMTLPLPSVRCKGLNPAVHKLVESALQAYDMTLLDMKVSFPRDRWFSKAQRACVVIPEHLSAEVIPDEHAAGQSAVVLEFQLDRGCYATMLIKALTASGEADV